MLKLFASSEEKRSLGNWFRKRRFEFFDKLIQSMLKEKAKNGNLPLNILDVGGTESYWVNMSYHLNPDIKITLVNLLDIPTEHPNIVSVKGDATRLINFKDKEFDITFSNSVIEHLYTYEAQQKMSEEVQRVGKKHFIQTPNKHFFIEPHYVLPFFQYLPKNLQYPILTNTKFSRGRKWDKDFARQYVDEIRLVSCAEMKSLFPESDLYEEKFLGLTKSFTAHNFKID